MVNELQELPPQPPAEPPVVEPTVIPPAPKRSNKKIWILLGGLIAMLGVCSVCCLALVAVGVGKIMVERAPVESVLDAFMKTMEAKDVESAYALFSPRSQHQT